MSAEATEMRLACLGERIVLDATGGYRID